VSDGGRFGKALPIIRNYGAAVWLVLAAGHAAAAACGPAPPNFVQAMLEAHNAYRHEVGVAPIAWSAELACGAQQWADHLIALGGMTLQHSSPEERQGAGENLWAGTAGFYRLPDLVGYWGGEKRDYHGGPVTMDNLQLVGHYTQMVWRGTTFVGCALARGNGSDILVCRYGPAGNLIGVRPY